MSDEEITPEEISPVNPITYEKRYVTAAGDYKIWKLDTTQPRSPYNPVIVPNDYQDYVDRVTVGEMFPEFLYKEPEPSSILPQPEYNCTFRKRFVDAIGNYEVIQVYSEDRIRLVRNDYPQYLERVALGEVFEEISYVPPVIIPDPPPYVPTLEQAKQDKIWENF